MHNKFKSWIVIILFLSLTILVLTLPEAKYVSTKFVSQLELPRKVSGWHGQDVSSQLGIDYGDDTFGFINEAVAYNYQNKSGESVLFIMVDAGNFHYPNVCLLKAGFTVTNLKKSDLHTPDGRTINAHSLYTEKTHENNYSLVLYWIVIDKEVLPNWAEQKVKQLFFSLFNKKRIGLMVRLDIPIEKDNIENGLARARRFINDFSPTFPLDKADYIFGEKL